MGTGGGGVPRVFGCEEKLAHVNQKHKGAQIPGWIGAGCIVQSVVKTGPDNGRNNTHTLE